jgi:hypothetical protein
MLPAGRKPNGVFATFFHVVIPILVAVGSMFTHNGGS